MSRLKLGLFDATMGGRLQEDLPLDNAISLGSTRRRILAVGEALDAEIERDIASAPKYIDGERVRESTRVGCVSVDSAWLNFSSSPKSRKAARDLAELKSPLAMKLQQARHVNIVAGRATFTNRTSRLYAYVHKQVHSAAARLDQFLTSSGVSPDERVTVSVTTLASSVRLWRVAGSSEAGSWTGFTSR